MKSKNIDVINELLIDNASALTDFYDEALNCGRRQGMLCGTIITLVGTLVIYGFKKIKSEQIIKTKEEV